MRTIRLAAGALVAAALSAVATSPASARDGGYCEESASGNFLTCCTTDDTGKIISCASVEVKPLQPVGP